MNYKKELSLFREKTFMYFFSPPADWPMVEVDSLSSNKMADGWIIRIDRGGFISLWTGDLMLVSQSPLPLSECPWTKLNPLTDPEVSAELDESRRLHVFIILEMYYMSGLFVWSLITVTVLASQRPHHGTTEDGTKWKQKDKPQTNDKLRFSDNNCKLKTQSYEQKRRIAERNPPSRTPQAVGEIFITRKTATTVHRENDTSKLWYGGTLNNNAHM